IFRRAMLRRRRVAQNQLSTRPLEPGEKPPQPPGKYWEKPWATDSPRGWAKIILTLAFSALGLIFLLTGAIAFLGRAAASSLMNRSISRLWSRSSSGSPSALTSQPWIESRNG
ncbi:MAG: hypothetical protein LAN62_16765, partial [Acidobacteriia bacterium]|nr:hypothetical protein [Terriglobia bacterium]